MATKKCGCGNCSECKSYMKGKYTESKDKKKDAKMTKGLTAAEKREFEKKDKAHGDKKKPKTMAEDKKIDAKIIKGIKKHSAHEKRESKAEEKREHSRRKSTGKK